MQAIREKRPDAAFLDVAMPGLSGVDVARTLDPPERPAIVFVTAYDRFAVHAFDLHAVDYLLKPFDRARLRAALERLRERGLSGKRSLALREFALGIEGLERFVQKEPLRRVHECVFGVLALESEPVDPRL